MKIDLPEVFLIVQKEKGNEDMLSEEKKIADQLSIDQVQFDKGCGIYKDKDDAIAVAKVLVKNNPERHLAVISAIGEF